jgi:hypothetical protein
MSSEVRVDCEVSSIEVFIMRSAGGMLKRENGYIG